VYAPTAKATPSVKAKFTDDLQRTLDTLPAEDIVVVLGDFNARVGKRSAEDDVWQEVRGLHGIGTCNEAGEQLLELCAVNNLTIMNTWFKKKPIHLGTWVHPATKQTHMIDFVMMRKDQRQLCTDVRVYRSACCWTDHYLVKGKLMLSFARKQRNSVTSVPFAVHLLRSQGVRDRYQQSLEQHLLQHPCNTEESAEEQWRALKDSIVTSADESFGRARKKQPDWFIDATDVLAPLMDNKARARQRYLQLQSSSAKSEFRLCQRLVKRAVDEAKEAWISRVIRDAEHNRDGKLRWDCIKKLQTAFHGRRPARSIRLRKPDGNLTMGPEELKQVWYEHFSRVLNVTSQCSQDLIDSMPSWEIMDCLDDPPTFDELVAAIEKMKWGKAGGRTGILPELILCGGPELQHRLLVLMREVWKSGCVVQDWKDAEIVPIPKKGDLKNCDNWRGISLLDVVGKLFGRIVQDRLQLIAEKVLPESQCGFRKGRGCVDMIFTARQLFEKSREHDDSLFTLFVDLRKAYDSVSREGLWQVLQKYGVPPVMLSLIRSCHDGMTAVVRVSDGTTDSINIRNGLRQGCTMAPVLFNLYFAAMVACWRSCCPEAGVTVRYKIGRKLVGDRTAKTKLEVTEITESKYADDVALYAVTRQAVERVAMTFVTTAAGWGLTVSLEKTKMMSMGCSEAEDNRPIQLENGAIAAVDNFTYLGSNITNDGEIVSEVGARLGKAARAFGCLRSAIFDNKSLSVEIKRGVYQAVVMSTLLYGSETWVVKSPGLKRLEGFHNRCVRITLGVSRAKQWKERITSRELAGSFGMSEKMVEVIGKYRCRWLGHLARMGNDRIPKQLLFGELIKTRPRHGPKKRWRDLAVMDVRTLGIEGDWFTIAQDRQQWSTTCEQYHLSGEGVEVCAANRPSLPQIFSCTCGRTFKRSGDLTRHKNFCGTQNLDNGSLEAHTFQCSCGRTFRRKGDLTRHSHFCKAT